MGVSVSRLGDGVSELCQSVDGVYLVVEVTMTALVLVVA